MRQVRTRDPLRYMNSKKGRIHVEDVAVRVETVFAVSATARSVYKRKEAPTPMKARCERLPSACWILSATASSPQNANLRIAGPPFPPGSSFSP